MISLKHPAFTSIIVIFLGMLTGASAGLREKTLLEHLLFRYNKLERPVLHENDTLTVVFGVSIMSLGEMNIAHEYLESNIWLTVKWNDTNLRWNVSDFGGVTNLRIPPSQVWTPDIYLYNSIHPLFDPTFETKIILHSDGRMIYVPPGILKSSCRTDATHYPFDEQKCELKFGSWTSDSSKIDLQLNAEGADLGSYMNDRDWDLIGAPAKRNAIYYACCPDPYVDVTYLFHLRRRGEDIFYGCTIALVFGAVAMLSSFLLPATSGQRMTIGGSTFFVIFGMGLAMNAHLGGKASVMVAYFCLLAFLIFVSILSNIFIVYIYNRNPGIYNMPIWLRKLVLDIIPPFILLNRSVKSSSYVTPVLTTSNRIGLIIGLDGQNQYEELVSDLQALVLTLGEKEAQTSTINDWQYFAIVLDRLTILFYIVVSIVFFLAYYSTFT